MSKPLIQVIGSLHLDFVTTTPRCPEKGETLRATRFDINAGGKGANQAAACGRAAFITQEEQDVEVQMVGAVGKDDPYYVSLLQTALHASGVSTEHVVEVVGTTTGSATIIVEEETGENRILFVPGAGFQGMDDAKEVLSRGSGGGRKPDVVVLQGEIPRNTVFTIVEHFNGSERTDVVFNPAPVWPQGIPGRTLQGLSALIVNETECVLLTQTMSNEGYRIKKIAPGSELTLPVLEELASQYHELLDIRTVVVTLGAQGLFYSQHSGDHGFVAALKIEKVVDTTAAGDTFVGYFATELARSKARGETPHQFDVAAACRKANAAAAKCVSRAGAMQSIPYGYD